MHEARIYEDPPRDEVVVLLRGGGVSLRYLASDGHDEGRAVRPDGRGEEALEFLRLHADEYAAIETAVLLRASRVLADQQMLAGDVADARATRDRLLALVEALAVE